jgi:hypothetical protein
MSTPEPRGGAPEPSLADRAGAPEPSLRDRAARLRADGGVRRALVHRARVGLKRADGWLAGRDEAPRPRPWDRSRIRHHFRAILDQRVEHLVEVRQPLVLISQIQRSGGTLLSQLFDHHPQVHAHPQELHTGYPNKETWPALDPDGDPEEWFEILWERRAERAFEEGYRKLVSLKAAGESGETFPFLFPPSVQKAVFDAAVERWGPSTPREIFDCYMTSYFNAWLDNRTLYEPDKRWVTAFTARLSVHEASVAGFFDTYADGRLISIVRDPRAWYLSARGYSELDPSERRQRDYGTIEAAVELWRRSTEAALLTHERYGERFRAVLFEDLLSDTEGTMRALADYLGIDYAPMLTEPTFNGMPIKADSSFEVSGHGISTAPLERFRERLDREELDYLERYALPLYERAAEVAR